MAVKLRRNLLISFVTGFLIVLVTALMMLGGVASSPVRAGAETNAFLASFAAYKGNVSDNDGYVTYTVGGPNSYFYRGTKSSQINEPLGSAYSVRLNYRNTLFLRIRNNTSATQLKFMYITSADLTFDEEKSALIDLSSGRGDDEGFRSYYFNLSANPKAEGYLRAMRIYPVGAAEGSIDFREISFSKEDEYCDYAAENISAVTDGAQVTVSGTLKEKYKNKRVNIYLTDISNRLGNTEKSTRIAYADASGTSFSAVFPYYKNGICLAGYSLFAEADGVFLSAPFKVSNSLEYGVNPYKFTLNKNTIAAGDCGAAGDGYTDDTQAIQTAIDRVNAAGGGKVVLKGDESEFGKRYVVTSLKLKSNVELYIGKGAMLLQSKRAADYAYTVTYGHDITLPNAYWTHASLCKNYPLIYAENAENVKITGEGKIRTDDTGIENNDYSDASKLRIGCGYRIHVIPVGMYGVKNIEITGISVERSSSYHIALYKTENVYIGGVTLSDCADLGGDGISLGVGTKNVKIEGCRLHVTDDAVVLWSSSNNEPRGLTWWHTVPDGDNVVGNIEITGNCISGGHGITFVTWGTDAADLSKQEISDITITGNVLAADGNTALAGWYDNPYYGASTAANGYPGEAGDCSPVKNVTIWGNEAYGYTTFGVCAATNVVSDIYELRSSSQFVNGNFERSSCQTTVKSGMAAGLSYWSYNNALAVGTVTEAGNTRGKVDFSVASDAELCQGLYLLKGEYVFSSDFLGKAKLTVRNSDGDMLAEKDFNRAAMAKENVKFTVPSDGLYRLGISGGAGVCLIDEAAVTASETSEKDKFYTEDFSGKGNFFLNGFTLGQGKITSSGAASARLKNVYGDFELKISCVGSSEVVVRFAERQYETDWLYYALSYSPAEKLVTLIAGNKCGETVLDSFRAIFHDGNELIVKFSSGKIVGAVNGVNAIEYSADSAELRGDGFVKIFVGGAAEIGFLQTAPSGAFVTQTKPEGGGDSSEPDSGSEAPVASEAPVPSSSQEAVNESGSAGCCGKAGVVLPAAASVALALIILVKKGRKDHGKDK